jgi:hypothetical protein
LSKDYSAGEVADLPDLHNAARPDIATGKVRWYAIVFLIIIAACLAEFLTGSAPILAVILNPLGFAANVGLYGGGALLIREATIQWRKRWGAVLLLGGAYAVGEEGFAAKTMIDPMSPIIGNQLYNNWAGVNWIPLTNLTVFHSAFSIAVPLILVELLFPETKRHRLLGKRGMAVTGGLYGLTVFLLTFFLGDPYVPSLGVDIFLVAYASAFIVAAYLVPRSFLQAKGERPDRRERNFFLLGLGFMGGFFLISGNLAPGGGFVAHLLSWPVTAVMILPLAALTAWYLVRHAGQSENDLVKTDFVLGMMSIFVPIDVLLELGGDVGVLVFTAVVIGLVIRLRQRFKHLEKPLPVSHRVL